MLTADLAGVRRRGGDLRLVATDAARRAHIEALAAALQAAARAHLGRPRDALEAAFAEAAASHGFADRRLVGAVWKLVVDGCRFEEATPDAAIALRRDVFRQAAAARRAATPTAPFDRGAVLAAVAATTDRPPADVEADLFADRPGAQRLLAVEAPPPAALADGFPLAEAQAVLLRATKVVATVRAREAGTYRHLFRTLKFLRLLPLITPAPDDGGLRIELDGPFSLFQGSTRYGLQLGLALPAIAACDRFAIEADVRWGNDRRPLRFQLAGAGGDAASPPGPPPMPDEIAALSAAFERLESDWRIDHAPAVLDLPGAGLCIPNLAFVRGRDGTRVHFELLGFWSREAVWRRVELVRAGLPHRILFAVSRTLRVGEVVLDEIPTAALYVFARVLNAKEVLARLEQLAG